MLRRKSSGKLRVIALALLIGGVALPLRSAAQAQPKPLTKEQIVRMLKGDVLPNRVAELARQRGIDFQLTPDAESELREAGATDELLATLRELAPKPAAPPTLLIQTTPGGAEVYVDDEPRGKTSTEGRLKLSQLQSGSRRVRIVLEGYRDYERTVELTAGQTAEFTARLETLAPKPAPPPTLLIQTTPGGAQVYVDDEPLGKTSMEGRLKLSQLQPGSRRVRIALEGYRDYERAVELTAGQTAEFTARLETAKAAVTPATVRENSNPGDANAHYFRGNAMLNKDDLDGAIAEYREAIRLKPDLPEAHYNLGRALVRKMDFDAGIAELREAIRLKPNYAEAHAALGLALVLGGDLDGAIAECREAIRLKPDLHQAHYGLGFALELKAEKQAALGEFRKAYELDPGNEQYRAAYKRLSKELKKK